MPIKRSFCGVFANCEYGRHGRKVDTRSCPNGPCQFLNIQKNVHVGEKIGSSRTLDIPIFFFLSFHFARTSELVRYVAHGTTGTILLHSLSAE